jgi:hypothetical protein
MIKILLCIRAVSEIFLLPFSHTAQVCAGFKAAVIDIVMLNNLPDKVSTGKDSIFSKAKSKTQSATFSLCSEAS